MEPAGLDPGAEIDDAGLPAAHDQVEEGDRPADRGHDHAEDGGAHGAPVADDLAQQAGDQGADQRREDGESVDHVSPSSG